MSGCNRKRRHSARGDSGHPAGRERRSRIDGTGRVGLDRPPGRVRDRPAQVCACGALATVSPCAACTGRHRRQRRVRDRQRDRQTQGDRQTDRRRDREAVRRSREYAEHRERHRSSRRLRVRARRRPLRRGRAGADVGLLTGCRTRSMGLAGTHVPVVARAARAGMRMDTSGVRPRRMPARFAYRLGKRTNQRTANRPRPQPELTYINEKREDRGTPWPPTAGVHRTTRRLPDRRQQLRTNTPGKPLASSPGREMSPPGEDVDLAR